MPLFYLNRKSDYLEEKYYAEKTSGRSADTASSSSSNRGENSCSVNLEEENQEDLFKKARENYKNLPNHLKSCLDYISICLKYNKDQLVRLLLAEGLIPNNTMEPIAEIIIQELIRLGMLQKNQPWDILEVVEPYGQLCVVQVNEEKFISEAANLFVRAILEKHYFKNPLKFESLDISSLFLSAKYILDPNEAISLSCMQSICKLQFLVVLDIWGAINELGNLFHLTYLGLHSWILKTLPRTLGNLQNLQTLYIFGGVDLRELPIEMLKLRQLKHLMVFQTKVRLPRGIHLLVNLQTCESDDICNELSTLTQLKKLGVKFNSENQATQVATAIMKMENLVCLSLETDLVFFEEPCTGRFTPNEILPEFEQFCPPCQVQELNLIGALVEIPRWILSMENLTKLSLILSNLPENEASILKRLRKLEYLKLLHAYNAKIIGKEFCDAGGFPSLETLIICSDVLVEWTEIVNGAFPNLRYLKFDHCRNMRFLTEDIRKISTLQALIFSRANEDLIRRLQGKENYKIKHIARIQNSGQDLIFNN